MSRAEAEHWLSSWLEDGGRDDVFVVVATPRTNWIPLGELE